MRTLLLTVILLSVVACVGFGAAGAQGAPGAQGAAPGSQGVAANDTTKTIAASDSLASMQEWAPLAWMIGDWTGTGTSAGVQSGTFSVRPELGGNVLVRRNEAQMTTGGTHRDLLIMYHERGGATRAIYFDNERHVINYTVTPTKTPAVGAVFLSDEVKGIPQFRLTYAMTDAKSAKITFELKPPGGTDFKPYLEGAATRK